MHEPRQKILWFALGSRIAILLLQFIFNTLCPDHEADAFRGPVDETAKISTFDEVVTLAFGGLTRWDGEYFTHIAKYGYTYENTLAFYPLYPLLIRMVATFLRRIFFMLNIHSAVIIAGILVNLVCFVRSAVLFYDLSKHVLKKTTIAYKAAVLYCINPANIFFSALYSESLFAYLTFYSMLASVTFDPYVSFPLALSVLTRSNGIVNLGFPVYCRLRNLYYGFFGKYNKYSLQTLCLYMVSAGTLRNCFTLLNTVIITFAPFLLLQIYNYIRFCVPDSNQVLLPSHVYNYGISNNLVLPGNGSAEWCKSTLPMAYSYIQRKYWNVGFLSYYDLKQIPNFLLAFPVLYIMILCIKEYIYEHKQYFCTLGLIENIKNRESDRINKYPREILVFIVHGLFLTISCVFFIHIQVSTRLICSASPLLYWYCALTMSQKHYHKDGNKTTCKNVDRYSKWGIIFLSQGKYFFVDKLILSYFLGYTIVGCFMFSNFLPWT